MNGYAEFPFVGQVARVERTRKDVKTGVESAETAYFITSLSPEKTSPKELLALIRGHWSIESLHWVRDMAFDEDRCRVRTKHGPRNLASLRNLTLAILGAAALCKGWTKSIRHLAALPHLTLKLIGA